MWRWLLLGITVGVTATVLALHDGRIPGLGGMLTVATASSPAAKGASATATPSPTATAGTMPATSPTGGLATGTAAALNLEHARVVAFGHVDVAGGVVPLSVPAMGQVVEILVNEGESVEAGQPLVRLHETQARTQLARAEAAIAEATVRLEQARRAAENLSLRRQRQQQAIDAARSRVEAQSRQYERLERLSRNQAIPDENLQSAGEGLRGLQAGLKAEELAFQQLELERPEENVRVAQAALAEATATRDAAADALTLLTLKAPEAGTVLRVLLARGQMVSMTSGQPALWFCPAKPRIVRCEIDQEFADRLREGLPADIYADGSTRQVWRGQVQRCSEWISQRRSTLDEPFQRNDVRTLECLIEFTGTPSDQEPLPRLGQRVRVVILDPVPAAGKTGSLVSITAKGALPSRAAEAAARPQVPPQPKETTARLETTTPTALQ